MNILDLFHHIHYTRDDHIIHHCGGEHVKIDPKLNYVIEHCPCGKHRINKELAIGHDLSKNEIEVIFEEPCPKGGWHVESGILHRK